MRTNVTWAEQVGGTASTDTVPWLEKNIYNEAVRKWCQLSGGINDHVLTSFRYVICPAVELNQPPCAVYRIQTPIHSSLPWVSSSKKNKVNSKNTSYKTRVNKCRKTPTITRIIRPFVVSIHAVTDKTTQGETGTHDNRCFIFF